MLVHDMQAGLRDYVLRVDVRRLIQELDRMSRRRQCCERTGQKERKLIERHVTMFKRLFIWNKRAEKKRTLRHQKSHRANWTGL